MTGSQCRVAVDCAKERHVGTNTGALGTGESFHEAFHKLIDSFMPKDECIVLISFE